eukprot:CAMPEP_0113546834 /NCGR_PEP_ID=MMETSP0015_2-20120614/12022_1 /TAXON_ID=2838 /ORGANISM="Odontella" /LENGTH=94 /DNA_ID=CAMNT_0000447325 /DNA_START=386 /DNA_END=670 /DNA_ORIENTATION=+ /assembly_acc=CAM_ASM_000160
MRTLMAEKVELDSIPPKPFIMDMEDIPNSSSESGFFRMDDMRLGSASWLREEARSGVAADGAVAAWAPEPLLTDDDAPLLPSSVEELSSSAFPS